MKRNIIKIDKDKCNGCGLCAAACQEGAIGMVEGKATLLRDDYCDGLGNCLPVCPTNAITFEEREALPFDEAAVKAAQGKAPLPCGCPGSMEKVLQPHAPHHGDCHHPHHGQHHGQHRGAHMPMESVSALRQWPVQIQLVSPNASFLQDARLLVAADCTAFARADIHSRFMDGRVTLIGCPKLDHVDYSEKLAAILSQNHIRSIQVLRMEVPCCGGIVHAVQEALQKSGKMIPWSVVTITTEGDFIEE